MQTWSLKWSVILNEKEKHLLLNGWDFDGMYQDMRLALAVLSIAGYNVKPNKFWTQCRSHLGWLELKFPSWFI